MQLRASYAGTPARQTPGLTPRGGPAGASGRRAMSQTPVQHGVLAPLSGRDGPLKVGKANITDDLLQI